jgi:hypothetical protein
MALTRLFLYASPPAVAEKSAREQAMCRNIKPLFNFDPPATNEEIRDAALQFVRKVRQPNHRKPTFSTISARSGRGDKSLG